MRYMTESQLCVLITPTSAGPMAAPNDPVPSINADTVAMALCVGTLQAKLADTAVVISEYGALMTKPVMNCNTWLIIIDVLEYL